jgi:Fe2+ or Zn2+ uptake regulation protein
MDCEEFLQQFEDDLAPKLDTYEQAIYLYIFRHSRLIDKEEVVIGFKSARRRMACGVEEHGKPMSDSTAYLKLQSLEEKGCIKVLRSERAGQRMKLFLPKEIPDLVQSAHEAPLIDLENLDFFDDVENRKLIIERDGNRCFYCLRDIDQHNHVIEHVVSRPEGNNSYRNVVAACRQCNNRKDKSAAEDFLRTLYREGYLNPGELQDRLRHPELLKAGELKPKIAV